MAGLTHRPPLDSLRPVSGLKRSRYGLLFHRGQSLGVVEYVVDGRLPPRGIHLRAPYVDGKALLGEPVTLHLDTGEQFIGDCQCLDPSAWLLFQPHVQIERHGDAHDGDSFEIQ